MRRDRIPVAAALVALVFHVLGNPHYGFFRDELYFIVCGRHTAFGYVDQPPLTPLLAALTQIFGISLIALRAMPAVLAAAAVYTTCRLVQELGGGAFAQILAAIAAVLAPILMVFGTQASPDMFELWLWPLTALFALRAIRIDVRWWLAAGAAIGVATESKYSAVLFALALIAGILLAPQRRALWNAWFAGGAGIAIAIALPNFLWQAHFGFPMLELLRNGQNGKNVVLTPLAFMGQQVFLLNPVLSIVWILGLVWSLYQPGRRWLGYAYLILLLAMIGLHAKNYYLAPVYPVLFALGATAIEAWTIRRLTIRSAAIALAIIAGLMFFPLDMPALPERQFVVYERLLARALEASVPATEHHKRGALPQDYADMHWLAATGSDGGFGLPGPCAGRKV
ncbi:MAG: glycosyltransferase family 39 protein [Candidatus Eremiobacteraeota bacterium]|nr:glycosyltransferase family 39 protein [Candidatus Eremiobacteraeota bacterium]